MTDDATPARDDTHEKARDEARDGSDADLAPLPGQMPADRANEPLPTHLTRDRKMVQVGQSYHLHARLHDPNEAVTLVGFVRTASSWIDGHRTSIWRVRAVTGSEYLCEAWQLSRVHPDEVYRQLRASAPD